VATFGLVRPSQYKSDSRGSLGQSTVQLFEESPMHAEAQILVTGATGNTASELLQQLETRGARVRAMVREQPDRGRLRGTSATVVGGNFNDPRSLGSPRVPMRFLHASP